MKRRTFLVASALAVAGCAAPQMLAPRAFQSERISVTTRGSGPDVVLIPGLGSSPAVWEGVVGAVPGYRYHLIQVHGFAGHAGNGGTGPLVAPVAEEIARYIGEAGLTRPALVGHSMGGTLAMMVAARHLEAVSRLMVVDMVPFMGIFFGPPGATVESVRPVAEQVRDRMAASSGEERRKTLEATIATMIRTEALRPGPVRDAVASDAGVSARAMYDLITTDLRPELKAITVPMTVLYVRGPNAAIDEAQMDAVYRHSFAGVPQARLERVPDAWHFIMLDQPERFHAAVTAFLGG